MRAKSNELSNLAAWRFRAAGARMLQCFIVVSARRVAESNESGAIDAQRGDHRQWLRGADGRDLRGARQLDAVGDRRARARRPAFAYYPRGEFSGLSGWDYGAGVDREHAQAGGQIRYRIQVWGHNRRGFEPAAVQDCGGQRDVRSEGVDCRGGSFGAIDRIA